jgi:hypothetical protein
VSAATVRTLQLHQPTTAAVEILDAKELAARLKLPTSWIMEATRSRAVDPVPHLKFGKYVRFRWGSPEMNEWLQRRAGGRKLE